MSGATRQPAILRCLINCACQSLVGSWKLFGGAWSQVRSQKESSVVPEIQYRIRGNSAQKVGFGRWRCAEESCHCAWSLRGNWPRASHALWGTRESSHKFSFKSHEGAWSYTMLTFLDLFIYLLICLLMCACMCVCIYTYIHMGYEP